MLAYMSHLLFHVLVLKLYYIVGETESAEFRARLSPHTINQAYFRARANRAT